MNGREFWALQGISDDELESSLSGLLGAGARVEARIVAHLAEVEARRLHLVAGYSSLYDYCRKRLGLSDYEAFIRIAAARVARSYPVVFEMLAQRQLHLTAICEVREYLTAGNHRELLETVSGKTKLQIRDVLAQRFPQADVPASLKKLPALEPLSPGRYRLQLTLSAEQKEKLELARDLLSHANRSGDLAVVVERALDELISRLEKRRFGRTAARVLHEYAEIRASTKIGAKKLGPTQRPGRAQSPTPNTLSNANARVHELPVPGRTVGHAPAKEMPADEPVNEVIADEARVRNESARGAIDGKREQRRRKHIANETRRELLARGDVRCAFVASDGRRCDARAFLQFHHRHAWACGGSDTADNLELLCRAHNRLLAERDFGRVHIEAAIAARQLEEPE
jgi:hypothetical protein